MDIGDRMKLYENLGAGHSLIPNLPVCIRIDGKAFHSWTRGLVRPYDERIQRLFNETTAFLVDACDAVIGYTQSDEITLILYNYAKPDSQVYFDGHVAKLTSVLASMATAKYNSLVPSLLPEKADRLAFFDTRVWNVPSEQEAVNVLVWREIDAIRNSIESAARALYSHKDLHLKNTITMLEMMRQKGVNWHEYPARFKRGGYFKRRVIERRFTADELESLPPQHDARKNPDLIVTRQVIERVELPSMLDIANRVEVVFYSAEPQLKAMSVNV